jgi:hypothetical protein
MSLSHRSRAAKPHGEYGKTESTSGAARRIQPSQPLPNPLPARGWITAAGRRPRDSRFVYIQRPLRPSILSEAFST